MNKSKKQIKMILYSVLREALQQKVEDKAE